MTDKPKPIIPSQKSLKDFFAEFAHLSTEFVQYDNGYRSWKYNYAQIARAAKCFAARLGEQGIVKGDKVIFWCENRPEWLVAFWGCVLAGVTVVPIDARSPLRFLQHIEQIVAPRLILIGEEVQLPSRVGQPAVWQMADFEWPTEDFPTPSSEIGADDVVEIVFTSGATGEPKGVLVTHRNILANLVSPESLVARYAKWFRPLFPLRFLCLIPLSHMFGQVLAMFIVPLIPGTVVFTRGYSANEIVRQIRNRRVSVLVAVPKILEVLRGYIQNRFPEVSAEISAEVPWVLRWWRYRRVHSLLGWKFWAFVVGAAPLPEDLERFWLSLGLAVVQGYGLTETAPIVAFNNPFRTTEGTVGMPVTGAEIRIAPDGEILVQGDVVSPGYYQSPEETRTAFEGGWFHTGDLGQFDSAGNLVIRGRKKEVIVLPDGLKVFPEDVEAVLNKVPGVRESAVVGKDRVHAVVVLQHSGDPNEIVRQANLQLDAPQRIRSISVWPGEYLPRTESTQKLKHGEIQAWVEGRSPTVQPFKAGGAGVIDLLQRYAPGRVITPKTTLGELGLSSLDRVELLIDLEQHLDRSIDESQLTGEKTVAALAKMSEPVTTTEFPAWNRSALTTCIRNAGLALCWLPLTRIFAHARVSGLENLTSLHGPVIFAPNHQSHFDTPVILSALPARFRFRMAVAMWKEYFDAHFHPERHTWWQCFRDTTLYLLVALFANGFPLPQSEAGARESLRYIGDLVSQNWSILFFPEGERTEAGEIKPFQPGIGLIAGHLNVPVVPIRLHGVEKVLHRGWYWPHMGRVEVVFGPPLQLKGSDYVALSRQIEESVRVL